MHRASAADNPDGAARASHARLDAHLDGRDHRRSRSRTVDDRGARSSTAREPDENRWDLMDPGALDSWSARLWYEPSSEWQFQVSHGFLKHPEPLEPGDDQTNHRVRDRGSQRRPTGFTAATVAFGRNDKEHGAFNAFLAEATDRRGRTSIYGRFESVDTETALLINNVALELGPNLPPSRVNALTLGAVRDLAVVRGFEFGVGADVTALRRARRAAARSTATIRSRFTCSSACGRRSGHMGRMWNMRMAGADVVVLVRGARCEVRVRGAECGVRAVRRARRTA